MSIPFFPLEESVPFTAAGLISKFREVFRNLPDSRKTATANNLRYTMEDAALGAFSVFFTQTPSFLDYQKRMEKSQGKNNAHSLFGIGQIPGTAQIRNILDPVSPETVFPLLAETGGELYRHGYFEPFRSVGGTLLMAVDGTDFFSSEKISCPRCTRQTLGNGNTLCRHTAVTPVIAAPGRTEVIPLPPAFVEPQDGHDKQDCELAAAKRWFDAWGAYYAPWGITVTGDDLYCHQPFCEEAVSRGFDVLLVCKPNSHPLTYEWIEDFERTGQLRTYQQTAWDGKRHLNHRYRYMNQVPLRNSDDALMLNWCELTVTDTEGNTVYKNAWMTTHTVNDTNAADVALAGRSRWKVENENNNVLKNQEYRFDHNFGHGKQHLSNLLATLILLAYLLHTALDWLDVRYRTVRKLLPSRRTFFEHLRALMQYFPFDNWEHLMEFMLKGLDGEIPDTG